jgi:hypothetical protein
MTVVQYVNQGISDYLTEYVTVPPQTLSLREAAAVLGIPESNLIGLLDTGTIESCQVGSRRMVMANSLFDYDRETMRLQSEALDELTQQAQELELY